MAKSKKQARQRNNAKPNSRTADLPSQEIGFVLKYVEAKRVYICGDFNDWQPTCLHMIGNPETGLWKKRLMLPAGRHEYKFMVDGQWLHDPEAGENVSNIYGSLNSVLEVRP